MGHLLDDLSLLEGVDLLRLARSQPEIEYLFRHTLVQEVAYDSLVKADRLALHKAAGEALERLYPDRLDEFAPQLGLHFAEAGDDEQALNYLTLAGDHAFAAFASAEAAENYTRALGIAKRLPRAQVAASLQHLYLRCGRAMELSSRYDAAVDLYHEMEALAKAQNSRPLELAAVMALATVRSAATPALNPALAGELIERAQRLAHELDDREAEAKIAWHRMMLAEYSGRPTEAVVHGERAMALAREIGAHQQLGFMLNDMSRVYLSLGQVDQARAVLEEAEVLSRELRHLVLLGDSLGMLAGLHIASGGFDRGLRLGAEATQLAQSIGNQWGLALGKQAGFYLLEMGEAERGIQLLREGVEWCEAARYRYGMFLMPTLLALAYEIVGAYDLGQASARRAVANCAAAFPTAQAWALPTLARLCIAKGELAEAQNILEAAEIKGLPAANWMMAHYAWEAEALLRLAQGDPLKALAVTEHALTELRPRGLRLYILYALELKGKALAAVGRAPEAREAYQEARALAEAIGSRRALWHTLAALARIAATEGDHAQAYQLRRQARTVIEYIADHIETPELLDSFLSLPDAREVMGQREAK